MPSDGHATAPAPGSGRGALLVARICRTCVRSLPVTGAAVSVMTAAGHRGVVFATDVTARRLDDVQFTLGTGPGVTAFSAGTVQVIPDIDTDGGPASGWPAFREAADHLGVRALLAFPLRLGAASLGVLTLYRDEVGLFDGMDMAHALRLADMAAAALLDLMVNIPADGAPTAADGSLTEPDAEFYRAEIYQAAGMVTVQLGVSIEVAMARLRAHAFATGRPTGEIARDIVGRKIRLEADTN